MEREYVNIYGYDKIRLETGDSCQQASGLDFILNVLCILKKKPVSFLIIICLQ